MLNKILKTKICVLLLCLSFSMAHAQTFSDVSSEYPYAAAIEELAGEQTIGGYPDGTFRPDNPINRVEFLKILLLGSGLQAPETQYNGGFPDVESGSWYAKYVVKGKEKGIVEGNPNGYFLPEKQVNFAEALKMIVVANRIAVSTILESNPFADVHKNAWYAPYFDYAKKTGIINKQSSENATPGQLLSRGEAAQLIYLFQNPQERNVTTKEPQETASTLYATYYADSLEGNLTASGEIFSQDKLTAAHKTLPFGTKLKVTNLESQEFVFVTVNDRGPYNSNPSYVLDLSKSAFQSISPLSRGVIEIKYEIITEETSQEQENQQTETVNEAETEAEAAEEGEVEPEQGQEPEAEATAAAPSATTEEESTISEETTTTTTEQVDRIVVTEEVAQVNTDSINCNETHEQKEIGTDFFKNVSLDQKLPNLFQKNEIYLISGKILENPQAEATVFLTRGNDRSEEYFFAGEISNQNFSIPVHFTQSGNFNLGILNGNSGESYITEIQIIDQNCQNSDTETAQSPTEIEIDFSEDQTKITWNNHGQKLTKIEISQNSNTIQYLINNGQNTWTLPYGDFENFTKGNVNLSISSAKSASNYSLDRSSQWATANTRIVNAVEHYQVFNVLTEIETDKLPTHFNSGEKIEFNAVSSKQLSGDASLIQANGLVEAIDLYYPNSDSTFGEKIENGQNFQFKHTPTSNEPFIIEINKSDGFAVINAPIYPTNSIPLIPDYWDINPHVLDQNNITADLEEGKNELQTLINASRSEHQRNQLNRDSNLDQLAQSRANDMAQNNYLQHKNLQGLYINDLKLQYGIKSNVSENIAKDINPRFTHEGLMRSAIHRNNILKSEWTRVGLGMATDSEGYLIVVEAFAENEVDMDDLEGLRQQIAQTINQNRNTALTLNTELNEIAQSWSAKLTNQNDVWFEENETGITLSYIVSSTLQPGIESASSIVKGYLEPILDQLNENETLRDTKWKNLGSGITQNSDGTLNVTIIYSN